MTDRKDVELRIRATDQSKQTLGAVSSSIAEITKALGQQVEAAKRGDESIEGLKESIKALKDAGTELIREQSLIDVFNRQAAAAESAQKKLEEVTSKYDSLKAKMDETDKPAKRLVSSFEASERAVQRAQTALEKTQSALERSGAKLKEAGIETDDLVSAQERLVNAATDVGSKLTAANMALEGYGSALKAARQAQQESIEADEKRQALMRELAKAANEQAEAERKLAEAEKAQRNAGTVATLTAELERQEAAEKAARLATEAKEKADNEANEAAKRYAEAQTQAAIEHEAAFQKVKRAQQEADTAAFWREQIMLMDAYDEAVAENSRRTEKAARDLAEFHKAAQQATMQGNGYTSFSGPVSGGNAAAGLRSITDPQSAARATMAGLQQQIDSLSAVATSGTGPVKNYAEQVRSLQAAMKSVVGTGEAIDAYERQVAAVRAARTAFTDARSEVERYRAAILGATAVDNTLTDGLKRAQAAMAQAQRAMQGEVETARQMQANLQHAGVATNDLAGETARLTAMASTARGALNSLNAAYQQHGAAADDAGKKVKLFGEGSRESLSWFQRVRGEVIALATAYVGLQGAIGLAQGAIEAFVQKQAVENRLGIVLGSPDQKAIGDEYSYVHRQAERLGIGINELADSYSRFALAGKNANMSLDQTKFAFERIVEVMRVNHASTEAVNGAFYQLEQMLSKNKIQMEDLRQASNWIPGLEGMLARGLGMVSVKQLFEAMKKGSVDAKSSILALGEEMERQYGKQIPESLKSLQAEQGRFNTSLTDFKRLIAESGFADAYTRLLQRLAAFFKSADGVKFAQDLSKWFSSTATVLATLVENLDAVKATVIAILALKGAAWFAELAIAIDVATAALVKNAAANAEMATTATEAAIAQNALAAGAGTAATAVEAAALRMVKVVGLITKAFQGVAAFVIGWEIGKTLDEKSQSIHKFSTYIAEELGYGWDRVMLGFERMLQKIAYGFKNLPTLAANAAREMAASVVDTKDPNSPLAGAADRIRASKTPLPPEDPSIEADFQRKLAAIEARHSANMKTIGEHGGYKNDGRALTPAEQQKADAEALAKDPQGYRAQADLADALANKERALNDIIQERANKVSDILDKRKKGELNEKEAEKQAEDVRKAYGPKLKSFAAEAQKSLQPLIDAAGFKAPMDKLQDFRSRLSAATGVYEPNLEAEEKKKKGDPIGTMDRSLQNDLSTLLARVDRSTVGTFDERLKASGRAIEEQYSQIFRKLDQYQKIGGKSVGGESISTIKAQVQAAEAQLKAAAALKLETEEIKKNETEATNIVKQRTDAYKDIEDRVKSGVTSPADGMKEAEERSKGFNAQLTAAIDKAIQFNEAMRGKPGIDNTKLDQSNSMLGRLRSQGADGGKAIRDLGTNLDSTAESNVNKILKERNDLTQSYANLVKLGLMTQRDAQENLKGDYDRTNGSLNEAIDAYEKLIEAQKQSGAISTTDYELATAKIRTFRSEVQYLNPDLVKMKQTVQDSFTKGFTDAFDKAASSIADLIDGSKNLSDVWHDFGNIIVDFFAQFAKSIANAIVQIEAMNIAQSVTQNSSNGQSIVGGLFSAVASYYSGGASVSHAGSTVGGGNARTSRTVDWSVFANAPRYHTGTNGPLGLRADEHATILQQGEEVLTAAQSAAMRRQAAPAKVQAVPVKQTLAIGDDEIANAMAGSAGEETTLTHIRRNADTIKQWLKS